MKNLLFFIAGILLGIAVWEISSCRRDRQAETPAERVTEILRVDTVRDTVVLPSPVRWRERVRVDTVLLATTDHDTVEVTVPIEQRVYEGESWRAVVSGWRPRLDTMTIDRIEVNRTERVAAKRRIFFGVQAGYGLTPRGFLPYIGVGGQLQIKL